MSNEQQSSGLFRASFIASAQQQKRPSTPFGMMTAFRPSSDAQASHSLHASSTTPSFPLPASFRRPGTPTVTAAKKKGGSTITPRNPAIQIGRKRTHEDADEQQENAPLGTFVDRPKRTSSANKVARVMPPPAFQNAHPTPQSPHSPPAYLDDNKSQPERASSPDYEKELEFDLPLTNEMKAQFAKYEQKQHQHDQREETPFEYDPSPANQQQPSASPSTNSMLSPDKRVVAPAIKDYTDACIQTDQVEEAIGNDLLPVQRVFSKSALPYLGRAHQYQGEHDKSTDKEYWTNKVDQAIDRIANIIERSERRAREFQKALNEHEQALDGRAGELQAIRKRIDVWTDSLDLLRLASEFQF